MRLGKQVGAGGLLWLMSVGNASLGEGSCGPLWGIPWAGARGLGGECGVTHLHGAADAHCEWRPNCQGARPGAEYTLIHVSRLGILLLSLDPCSPTFHTAPCSWGWPAPLFPSTWLSVRWMGTSRLQERGGACCFLPLGTSQRCYDSCWAIWPSLFMFRWGLFPLLLPQPLATLFKESPNSLAPNDPNLRVLCAAWWDPISSSFLAAEQAGRRDLG